MSRLTKYLDILIIMTFSVQVGAVVETGLVRRLGSGGGVH